MKKLLFLLLVMALGAGMVFAMTPDDPPGVFNPETIMAEYSVQQGVVTQPSELVFATLGIARPSSIQAVMVHDNLAIQPDNYLIYDKPSCFGQIGTSAADTDYYLRC